MNTTHSFGVLPPDVVQYSETKVFTAETVPDALTQEHRTKDGVWGLICMMSGTLEYEILGEDQRITSLSEGETAVVAPTVAHRVHPGPEAAFKVVFYRKETERN